MSDPSDTGRRTFFFAALSGLGALFAAAVIAPALRYLFYSPPGQGQPGWVEAGAVDQFEVNEPKRILFRRNSTDAWKVVSQEDSAWVLRTSPSQLVAFSPWCTHLGCAYRWDARQRQFLCPCHGSVFAADGKVVAGPAPRPLDRYETKQEGDVLWLGPVHQA